LTEILNAQIAQRLEEVGRILEEQRANPHRVRAYRRAAEIVRDLPRPLSDLLDEGGMARLEELPGIGPSLARSIRDLVLTGRLPMLDRLRGHTDPVALLATVPGIGRRTAARLHYDLDIETLEELESAAYDGRLAMTAGFGEKRLAGVRESIAQRLGRVRRPPEPALAEPSVAELLDVDREYRERAAAGELLRIAPKRLNPAREAWLPVLHTHRGDRHYTALFSNTPRAHRMRATHDWVILYYDAGRAEHQATVVTARRGELKGHRIVMGREEECASLTRASLAPPQLLHAGTAH
jgi:hypothetical protein